MDPSFTYWTEGRVENTLFLNLVSRIQFAVTKNKITCLRKRKQKFVAFTQEMHQALPFLFSLCLHTHKRQNFPLLFPLFLTGD